MTKFICICICIATPLLYFQDQMLALQNVEQACTYNTLIYFPLLKIRICISSACDSLFFLNLKNNRYTNFHNFNNFNKNGNSALLLQERISSLQQTVIFHQYTVQYCNWRIFTKTNLRIFRSARGFLHTYQYFIYMALANDLSQLCD